MDKKWSLKYKPDIDTLFIKGKSEVCGPILIRHIDSVETKFVFAVSTKLYRRANKRNYIKRIMRVSVANKKELMVKKHIAFVYIGTEIKPFEEVENCIRILIDKCLL